jgi:Glycosyl transferase family 2
MKRASTSSIRRSVAARGSSTGVKVPEPHEPSPAEVFLHEGLRRARRRRLAASSAARRDTHRRRAVLTMAHNEGVFLPIWLRYYSRFFGAEDIYILDHDSSDASTDRDGFVRIPVTHGSVDHTWMVRTIEGHQRELLDRYDVVLVTDVDEIVAPRPECGTLGDYIDRLDEEFVNCLGYEIIHLVDREGPFDPSRAVLDQRGYWFPNHAYSKPALAMEPSRWVPGFHTREDGRTRLDPDLRLIHLHRMDYEICLARHRYRRGRPWNERDLAERWARHNLIVDEAEFARWFYEDNSFDDSGITVQPIPASWRGLF